MATVETSGRSRRSASTTEAESGVLPADNAAAENDEEEEQLSSQPADEGDDEGVNDADEAAGDNGDENANAGEEEEVAAHASQTAEEDEEGHDAGIPEDGVPSSQNDEETDGGDAKQSAGKETRLTRKTSFQAGATSEVKTRSALVRDGQPQTAAVNSDSKMPQRMATRRGLVITPAAPPPTKGPARKPDAATRISQPAVTAPAKKKGAEQPQQPPASGRRSEGLNDRENGVSNIGGGAGTMNKDGVWDKFPTWAEILQSYFTPAESTDDTLPTDAGRIRMKCQLCDFTGALKPADWNVTGRHIKTHHPVLSERLRKYQPKYLESKQMNSALPDLPPISDDRNDGYDEHADTSSGGNKSPSPVPTRQQMPGKAVSSPHTRSSDRRQQQSQQNRPLMNGGGKKMTRSQAVAGTENQGAEHEEEKIEQPAADLPKTRSGRILNSTAATVPTAAAANNKKSAAQPPPNKRGTRSQAHAAQQAMDTEEQADEEAGEMEQPHRQQTVTPKTRGAGNRKPALDKTPGGGATTEIGTMEQRKFDVMLAYFDVIAPPVEQLTQLVGANAEARQRCVLRCTVCQASMRIVWADCNGMLMHMQNKHAQLLKQIKRLNPELFRENKAAAAQQHQHQQQQSGQKLGKQAQSQQALQQPGAGDEFLSGGSTGSRSQPVPMATRRSGGGASQAGGIGPGGGSANKYKHTPTMQKNSNKGERGTPNNSLSVLQQQQLALQNSNNKVQNQRANHGMGMKSAMSATTIAKSDDELRQFINTNASTTEADLKKHLYQSVLFFYTDFRMRRDAGSERFTALDENLTIENDDLLARSSSPVWQVIQTLSAEAPDQETRTMRRKTPLICACRLCGLTVSIRFSDIAAALDHLKRSHVRLARCLMRMREIYRRRPKAAAYLAASENLFRLLYFAMFGSADDETINQQLGEAQQQDGDLLGLHLNVRSTDGLEDLLMSLNREDAVQTGRKRTHAESGGEDYAFQQQNELEDDAAPNGGLDGGDEAVDDAESLNSDNAAAADEHQYADEDDRGQQVMTMNGVSSGGRRLKHATIAGGQKGKSKKQRSASPVEKPVGRGNARGVQLVRAKDVNNNIAASTQLFMMEPPQSTSTAVELPIQPPAAAATAVRKQLICVHYQFSIPQPNQQPAPERTIIMLPNVGPTDDAEQLEQSCLSRVVQLIHILEEEGTSMGAGSARYELPTDGVTVVDRLLMLGFQVEAQSSSNQQIMWTLTTTE